MTTVEDRELLKLPEAEPRNIEDRLRGLVRWEGGLVILFVASLFYGASTSPYFMSIQTFFFAGLNFGEIAIMALPMTFIIITGEIDLSVASMLGLSASILGYLFMHGWSIWAAMAIVWSSALSAVLLMVFSLRGSAYPLLRSRLVR